MCVDMCVDMCMDMSMDMRIDMCMDMCIGIVHTMCMDMCMDMCTDTFCPGSCIGRHRHCVGNAMCVDWCFLSRLERPVHFGHGLWATGGNLAPALFAIHELFARPCFRYAGAAGAFRHAAASAEGQKRAQPRL